MYLYGWRFNILVLPWENGLSIPKVAEVGVGVLLLPHGEDAAEGLRLCPRGPVRGLFTTYIRTPRVPHGARERLLTRRFDVGAALERVQR